MARALIDDGIGEPATGGMNERAMIAAYDALVAAGTIESDPAQKKLVCSLDALILALENKRLASKSSSLGWLFGKGTKSKQPLKGIYIWGAVGRGKSMLMDLFFDHISFNKKKRVHFNDFMQDIHLRIHAHRQALKSGTVSEKDPIPPVARQISDQVEVLCFDEFSVTDIADAMLLGRLFSELFKNGVVVVATSNVEPEKLYTNGLNRSLFLPFIETLKSHVSIFELEARTDFRLEKLNRAPVYLSPLNAASKKAMDEAWYQLTGTVAGESSTLEVRGRQLIISETERGVARMSFEELCVKPRGVADYLAIARGFHTILIDEVPVMGLTDRNAAKRFILLIDTLYDNHIKLVVSAAANPAGLYQADSGTEAFEFERTASRLIEMQSMDYLGGKLAAEG